jgi:hypothetical protein
MAKSKKSTYPNRYIHKSHIQQNIVTTVEADVYFGDLLHHKNKHAFSCHNDDQSKKWDKTTCNFKSALST